MVGMAPSSSLEIMPNKAGFCRVLTVRNWNAVQHIFVISALNGSWDDWSSQLLSWFSDLNSGILWLVELPFSAANQDITTLKMRLLQLTPWRGEDMQSKPPANIAQPSMAFWEWPCHGWWTSAASNSDQSEVHSNPAARWGAVGLCQHRHFVPWLPGSSPCQEKTNSWGFVGGLLPHLEQSSANVLDSRLGLMELQYKSNATS